MIAPQDRAARIDSSENVDPMENADANDPIEPTDRVDPIEPIESTDPFDPIDRNESSDHSDQADDRGCSPGGGRSRRSCTDCPIPPIVARSVNRGPGRIRDGR